MQKLDFNEKPNTAYAIDLWLRDEQIKSNIKRVKGRVEGVCEELKTEPIAVVGFGPSLKKTWKEIKKFKYVMTCSGAHPFLISKGIIPTYHLAVDPLPKNTVQLIGEPHPDVEYLIASTCHPDVITHLQDFNLKLWHIFASDDEGRRTIPRGEWSFTGGSDAGLRCLVMARVLGFSDIHVFGLDGSGTKTVRHAGKHPTQGKEMSVTEFNGKTYYTTPSMLTAVQGVVNEIDQLTDCTFKFYGEGLVQDVVKAHSRNTDGSYLIAFEKPELISKEMKEMNRQLHLTNPTYGTSGKKYVEAVRKMAAHKDIETVLDYGCGRGYLQKGLGFPIYEYDPAIEGKDSDPIPADLVCCTDVLEHVEPDKLKFVLDDLKRVTKQVGFFVIHLGEAVKTYANGKNAHLIVKPSDWWTKQIGKYFKVAMADVKGKELHVIVSPKTENIEPTAEIAGARFHVPNETTEWRVNTLLKKEPVTIDWIEGIGKGEVLYDIGANMGGYSVLAGLRGVDVYSFEPEAENYALLTKNLALNGLKGNAYCLAVSDQTKLDVLHMSSRGAGGSCHSFAEDKDAFGVRRNGTHPTQGCFGIKLDDLNLPKPDHLKIDVDGFEPQVIKGGLETLKNVRTILVEVNPQLPQHLEMIETLTVLGFHYDEEQVERSRRKDGPFKGVAEYLFYRNPLIKAIEDAELIQEPFPHFVMDFPVEVELPVRYEPMEKVRGTKGYPERYVAPFNQTLGIKQALLKKFGLKDQGFTDEYLLIKDLPGYQIGPHTDSPSRVLSLISYLTDAEDGTVLYSSNRKCQGGPHYPAKGFNKVKTVPHKKGTALVFLKTDHSWHGVEKAKAERNVLLYDIRRPDLTSALANEPTP